MSKLEQIIEDYNDVIDWDGQVWLIDFEDRIKGIAIEYAEFYAKRCLAIAENNLVMKEIDQDGRFPAIESFNLPEHE